MGSFLKRGFNVLLAFLLIVVLFRNCLHKPRYFQGQEAVTVINLPLHPIKEKLILTWSTLYGRRSLKAWESLGFNPAGTGCPSKCRLTTDKRYFNVSDAVLYHGYPEGGPGRRMYAKMYPLPRPGVRDPNQVWILFMLEPPAPFYSVYESIGDTYDFNWTLTYRLDSDIRYQYGQFLTHSKLNVSVSPTTTGRKLVAGMMSNCKTPSRRTQYIRQLQKHFPVDIYGKCGNDSCSKGQGDPANYSCHKQIGSQYKFWLAFENSVCADYVTEKFYLPMLHGSVPIYYGDPKGVPHAPPDSYINAHDWGSPEGLAGYLIHLDRNPAEYRKYFEWRRSQSVLIGSPHWCELCTKLHGLEQNGGVRKAYRSMADWILRNDSRSSVCLKARGEFS